MKKYKYSLAPIIALVSIMVLSGIFFCGCGSDKQPDEESGTTAATEISALEEKLCK